MPAAEPVAVLDPSETHLTIIGCGGTGAFLLRHVCRLLWGLAEQRRAAHEAPQMFAEPSPGEAGVPDVMVVDGDVVERKNVIRQDFVPADVGRPKALVLAERYSAAYGLTVRAYPRYLGRATPLEEIVPSEACGIVAGCVDNAPTRALLDERLRAYSDVVYLDSGNAGVEVPPNGTPPTRSELTAPRESGWDGQVLCGVRKSGEGLNPFPAEEMPDLIESGEGAEQRWLPDEIPCGEVVESLPQRQMTNLLAATVMMGYLTTLLSEGTLLHSRSFFCARRGFVKSYPAADELDEAAPA